jgi:hypothetical protein
MVQNFSIAWCVIPRHECVLFMSVTNEVGKSEKGKKAENRKTREPHGSNAE